MRLGFLAVTAASVFLASCDQVLGGAGNRFQEDFHYSYPLNAAEQSKWKIKTAPSISPVGIKIPSTLAERNTPTGRNG